MGPKTSKWDEINEENKFLESDELLLRNTFLNAQNGPVCQMGKPGMFNSYPRKRLLKWRDFIPDPAATSAKYTRAASHKRLQLAELTNPKRDLINLSAVIPQANHRRTGF